MTLKNMNRAFLGLASLAIVVALSASCSGGSNIANGSTDAGAADSKPSDAMPADTGPRDAGETDTGPRDTQPADTSPVDSTADMTADSADAADSSGAFTSSYPGDNWQGETHLAVGANGYVAAAWMASNGLASAWMTATQYIGYAFSTDSGSTWTPVQVIYAPISGHRAFDPSVAVDAANNFYVSFLTLNKAYTESHVYVATAPSGTTTFGAPSEVTDPAESMPSDAGLALYAYDKPWIAVTRNQEIVVAYTRFDASSCPFTGPNAYMWTACVANIVLGRSTDAMSWTRVQVTTNTAGSDGGAGYLAAGAFACVSTSTSRLWVAHDTINQSLSDFGVMLHYSDDDGATWSPSNTTVIAPVTATGLLDSVSCAGNGSDVWVAYELYSGVGAKAATSIQVAHSTDGGTTFGASVNALDAVTSAVAWNAQLTLESNGHLDVEYYGGASVGTPNGSVYYVHSTDQGSTWGTAMLIKSPITLVTSGFADGWLGDYLGVATSGGSLYTTFTANASGTSHVDFAKEPLP